MACSPSSPSTRVSDQEQAGPRESGDQVPPKDGGALCLVLLTFESPAKSPISGTEGSRPIVVAAWG